MKKALGFLLLSAGLFLSSSHLFLALWTWSAHGQADIIARGSLLSVLLSPYFSVAIALITIAIAIAVARRRRQRPASVVMTAAAAVGLTYLALYADRTNTAWHIFGAIRLAFGSLGYTALEVFLLITGGYLIVSPLAQVQSIEPAV